MYKYKILQDADGKIYCIWAKPPYLPIMTARRPFTRIGEGYCSGAIELMKIEKELREKAAAEKAEKEA